MNNLSEKQRNAKQSLLNSQQARMLETYRNADTTERAAVIRQIDGFLPTLSGDEKGFWLSFRQKLERIGEKTTAIVKGEFEVKIAKNFPVAWIELTYTNRRRLLIIREVRNNG